MNETVSVIMPVYNVDRFISETIQSVIDQTYTNWELIIVDDCSTDGTAEIIREYAAKDERIKFLQNEKNSGAAASRNYALRKASGRWIAFLDSDDLWLPRKLEEQIKFMEENDYRFSYTAYEQIDENSMPLNIKVDGPAVLSKRKMFRYCYPGCLTVMYDRSVVGLIQIPDVIANGENDYAIWLKVIKICKCFFLNDVLSLYRVRSSSLSHKSSLFKLIGNHYRLFRISESKSVIGAVFCTLRNLFFGFFKKVKYVKKQKIGSR